MSRVSDVAGEVSRVSDVADEIRGQSGAGWLYWSFVSMLARVLGVPEADGGYSEGELCNLVLDALAELLEEAQEAESGPVRRDMGDKPTDGDCGPNTGSGGPRREVALPVDRRGVPVDVGCSIYLAHNGRVRRVTGLTLFGDGRWGAGCDSGGSFMVTGNEGNVTVLTDSMPSREIYKWLDVHGCMHDGDSFVLGKFGTIGRDDLMEVADRIDEAFARRDGNGQAHRDPA